MFLRENPQARDYIPPRMDEERIRALEEHIRHSRDATPFAKRLELPTIEQLAAIAVE
jgi:hypothetical protein